MRKRLILLIAGMTVLAACSSNGTSSGTGSPSAPAASATTAAPNPPAGAQVKVTQIDFQFQPSTIVMTTKQSLSITNSGSALHNFSIQGTQVDLDTAAGQFTNTEAIGGVVTPGNYQFFCKYHRSRGMTGTITILPG